MKSELHEINVTLSNYQKKKIRKAFNNREKIFLRLKNENLIGSDTLLVPSIEMPSKFIHPYDGREIPMYTIVDNLETKRKVEKGMIISMDYRNMCDSIIDSVAKNIKTF